MLILPIDTQFLFTLRSHFCFHSFAISFYFVVVLYGLSWFAKFAAEKTKATFKWNSEKLYTFLSTKFPAGELHKTIVVSRFLDW